MNFARAALLSSLLLAGTASAYAQDTIVIAPEQETVIREYVVKHPVDTVEVPADYSLGVGTVIPDAVRLVPVDVPDVSYDYVVLDGQTVIVDRGTRKVIRILD